MSAPAQPDMLENVVVPERPEGDDQQSAYRDYLEAQAELRAKEELEALSAKKRRERIQARRDRLEAAAAGQVPSIEPAPGPAGKAVQGAADVLGDPARVLKGAGADLVVDFARFSDDVAASIRAATGKSPEEIEALRESQGVEQALPESLFHVDRPATRVGGVARDLLPWLFVARKATRKAGEALASLGAEGGKAAQVGSAAFGGVVADMTTVEEGFDSLIEAHPELRNPLTDWVVAVEEGSPDASELEKRARRALVGAGVGALLEGTIAAGRAVARWRRASRVPGQAEPPLAGEVGVPEEALSLSPGQTKTFTVRAEETRSQAVERLREAETRAGRALGEGFTPETLAQRAAELPEFQPSINWDRITDSESAQKLLDEVSRVFEGDIQRARRGVQTNEATRAAAEADPLSVADVLGIETGRALNASQTLAARQVLSAANNKLDELATAAASPVSSPADLAKFRKMVAVHEAITERVLGIRAEAGRSLQQWNIKVGGEIERARLMGSLLDEAGGDRLVRNMARRYQKLRAAGVDEAAVNAFLFKGATARTMDALAEAYRMNLLWSPKTHIVNMASPYLVLADWITERRVAESISGAVAREGTDVGGRVEPGEAVSMMYGATSALRDLFEMGFRSAILRDGKFSTGVQDLRQQAGVPATSKIDFAAQRSISGRALVPRSGGTGLARAIDFIGSAMGIPGAALGFEDDVAKVILHRAELYAQAHREAARLIRAEGGEVTREGLATKMKEVLENPPEHARVASVDAALEGTFTTPLARSGERGVSAPIASAAQVASRAWIIGPAVFTYVRTPANILRYGFERMPGVGALVGQWRHDFNAGGARRDIALAKMSVGAIWTAMAFDYALSGQVTGRGPLDPGDRESLRNLGWEPDAVRVGDHYVRMNRFDTRSYGLTLAASIVEMLNERDISEEHALELEEILGAFVAANGAAAMSKSWLQGISETVDFFRHGDIRRYATRQLGPLVPFATLLETGRQLTDPTFPEVNGYYDVIEARVAELQERLPRLRNRWGEPIKQDRVFGAMFDAFSPVTVGRVEESFVDKVLGENRIGVEKPRKKTIFDGVNVNFYHFPKVYEAYVQLAGGGEGLDLEPVRIGGKSLKEALASEMRRPGFAELTPGPAGQKARVVRKLVSAYRKAAQIEIMRDEDRFDDTEFVEFRDHVADLKAEKRAFQGVGTAPGFRAMRVPERQPTIGGGGR